VRQTKIVATIGPASSDRAIVESLVAAGVNVFRLNFSHGSQAIHRATLDTIRAVAAGRDGGRYPAGSVRPAIRTGELEGGQASRFHCAIDSRSGSDRSSDGRG
jgi:pyruvate kinase